MKKTKALFASMIIIVVAAASAGLWYLNENGKLGSEEESQVQTTIDTQNEDENGGNSGPDDNGSNNENETTTGKNEETTASADADIPDTDSFLTAFSNVYFAESTGKFDINNCSDYELIMFAYLHIKNTDKSLLSQEKREDNIVYYTKVSYDDINEVVKEYFGVSVEKESVFTENDYEFFRYENGYFFTPSADGIAYTNTVKTDTVAVAGDIITVEFTVYSGSSEYASGEAKIRKTADGMILQYYRIYF